MFWGSEGLQGKSSLVGEEGGEQASRINMVSSKRIRFGPGKKSSPPLRTRRSMLAPPLSRQPRLRLRGAGAGAGAPDRSSRVCGRSL